EAFREEVRSFIRDGWPLTGDEAGLPLPEQEALFRERATERGYLNRGIPRKYGGSEQEPDVLKARIILEEFGRAGAPGEIRNIGPSMLVPTLLECGNEEQKRTYIPPTIRGEMLWCQGYSEPGAGSDLASLQTRAERVGDEWVINGQKIWTSAAQFAQMMFCLCRSEPEEPRHAGISYLLIPMDSPGIQVSPLKQMTGGGGFCEVFFDDVHIPAKNIVGKRGEGWIVSRSTLKHERALIGSSDQLVGSFQRLVALAKQVKRNGRPALESPEVRQKLVQIEGYVDAQRRSGDRLFSAAAHGKDPGPVGMMMKLNSTNVGHMVAKLALDLIGDAGLLAPDLGWGAAERGLRGWVGQYMSSISIAIAGGTANIQRNIIGERGLGLPRDSAAQRR
ncbi:MAG: acyl-CoA dehydrogenase family protein, partial [Myxococcota bacterium]